ncbi:hypothetical protein PIB30_011090 [Stylosanthes scabra]|uniref:Uncharacterized protein n=1 Tax=Stylosanthes scabra TaxID=79078 RepID=A0ABU6Y4I1_9FABA|nr:hypothetical protein [Stylosanthes scabra]
MSMSMSLAGLLFFTSLKDKPIEYLNMPLMVMTPSISYLCHSSFKNPSRRELLFLSPNQWRLRHLRRRDAGDAKFIAVLPSNRVRVPFFLTASAFDFHGFFSAERERIEAIEALDSEVSNFDFHGLPTPLPPSLQGLLDIRGSKEFFTFLESIEALVIAKFLSLMYSYLNISISRNIVPDEIKGREIHHSFPMTLFSLHVKMNTISLTRVNYYMDGRLLEEHGIVSANQCVVGKDSCYLANNFLGGSSRRAICIWPNYLSSSILALQWKK